jgi:hypothetical protein
MSILTRPIFYYGFQVTVNDIYINFDEGSGELAATVTAGVYSFTGLASAVATALNNVGSQVYTVSANRLDRTYTISSVANFDLLFATGANTGLSIASVIGFDVADVTGSNSYTGTNSAGSEFIPQFPLQNYVDLEDFVEVAQANINESASGLVEVYSIGSRRFTEFNVAYTTDNDIKGQFLKQENAIANLRSFMLFLITKGQIEMMKDREDRDTFTTLILEKTPSSSTGTGFKLKELYNRKLLGFYETGQLVFREVN